MKGSDLLILGSLAAIAFYISSKNTLDWGGVGFPVTSVSPDAHPTDLPADNRQVTPKGSGPISIVSSSYPGIQSSTVNTSTYKGYIAAKTNPSGIPSNVGSSPAFLMSKVLPGGSGGVIQGLLPTPKTAALPGPRITTAQKIAKVLPGW